MYIQIFPVHHLFHTSQASFCTGKPQTLDGGGPIGKGAIVLIHADVNPNYVRNSWCKLKLQPNKHILPVFLWYGSYILLFGLHVIHHSVGARI